MLYAPDELQNPIIHGKNKTMTNLGALRQLDARSQWAHEAYDFTPWLATDENIQLLGDALGFELEVEDTEVAVGPYSADILARDSGTGDFVVIENQLGKTDHDHLGKMITYAAFLDASAIAWIATDFTDEHKKALDWLNDNSDDSISYFGIRLELWKIDDSRPAVRFSVISRPPNLLRRSEIIAATGPLTDTKRLQLEWWTEFGKALAESDVIRSVQKPRPQNWYDVALGRTGINLSNFANTERNKIGIRVYISGRNNADAAITQLLEDKQAIEDEIGESLLWNPNPDKRDKVIILNKDADISQRNRWPEYIDWMVKTTEQFHMTFGPRVKALDLTVVSESVETLDSA